MILNSKFLKADTKSVLQSEAATNYSGKLGHDVVINDLQILENSNYSLDNSGNRVHVFLPVVGGVILLPISSSEVHVFPEEVYVDNGSVVSLLNPFENQKINLIHFVLPLSVLQNTFSLGSTKLQLAKNTINTGQPIKIGVYDSRQKDVLRVNPINKQVLVYIINGSFEVDGRLMEHRDGLLLMDIKEVEFEALSEIGIILAFEW